MSGQPSSNFKVMSASGEVNLLIPSILRPDAGGYEELRLSVEDGGASVAEVLDAIGAQYPRLDRRLRNETGALRRYVNLYLNGEDIRRLEGLGTRIAAGQELLVIQSVAGG